ncbi:DUF4932 domain-containing protein [Carboxylicivirga linearis]|uniref:DUF4932 domain-containing protein n=1 Tax=Carboxylicivirga linearis TaxID=1628157 RepID=A0ABS5K2K4_9BACT|nr:DUF4932 domain-containing protein [Carboxylicivirga linearis]MBS2100906.1 DUF4932 domain-containing protein [Carboxylicivirga linearis]
MKKQLIALICGVLIVSTGYAKNSKSTVVASRQVNGLTISIDRNQELISIVQYLGDYFRLNKHDLQYKKDVDEYFKDYKQHKAVLFVQELTKKGFSYDAPPALMLHLSADMDVKVEVTDYLIKRIGGKENLHEFLSVMKAFVRETQFDKFIKSYKSFYEALVDNMANKLADFDEIHTIEQFYGKKQNSYNIILSCLNSGNYGPGVEVDGKVDIYNIMSAINEKDGQPVFGDVNYVEYLVWHEFGHSYVNYLTEENNELVDKYKKLYEPIKEPMKKQAYGNWNTVVNEQVIRAITTYLTKEKYGVMHAEMVFNKEVSRSFIYTESMLKALETYSKNRDEFKTFADYYTTLIKTAFDDAIANDYANRSLINLNNTFEHVDYLVVSEEEEGNEKEIKAYVTKIRDRFMKETQIITDKEALAMDVSQYSFMVYGTVRNNLFLQKYKESLPIQFTDSGIQADKDYELEDGKTIFNMPNPTNPKKYFIVYTAQEPSGIVDINNVFHGPSNYVVFEDRQHVLKSGMLQKVNGKWICK